MAKSAQLARPVLQVILQHNPYPHHSPDFSTNVLPPSVGPTGPSGAPGIAYAFLACFYQTGSSTNTLGRVLSSYINTFTASANAQCSVICNTQAYNFFGTVNTNTTTPGVDCYCGNTLNFVTAAGLGSGMAPDNNCAPCYGGPQPPRDCGVLTSTVVRWRFMRGRSRD